MSKLSDKTLHVLAGAAVALVVVLVTGSAAWASVAASVAGAIKEFADRIGAGTVDPADFACTVLGGAAVAVAWAVLVQGLV